MATTRVPIGVRASSGDRSVGVLLIVLSGAGFGTLALFARVAYAAGVDPRTLLFLRFTFAAVPLVPLLRLRPRPLPRGRVLLTLVLMGGVGYVSSSLTYLTALTLAPASLVALLLYLYPGLVTVLSVLVLRERLSALRAGALVLALLGLVGTIGPAGGGHPLGILLALASAAIYAVYILVGSTVSGQASALGATLVIQAAAAVGAGLLVALHGPALPRTGAGWVAIGAIALVATVLPIGLFFAGLKRVGPSTAATLSTVEPVVTVLLATLFLHEALRPVQVLGGLCILVAVMVLASQRRIKPAARSSP